jgi:hypothetical protein
LLFLQKCAARAFFCFFLAPHHRAFVDLIACNACKVGVLTRLVAATASVGFFSLTRSAELRQAHTATCLPFLSGAHLVAQETAQRLALFESMTVNASFLFPVGWRLCRHRVFLLFVVRFFLLKQHEGPKKQATQDRIHEDEKK